jgi:hypothetical protein
MTASGVFDCCDNLANSVNAAAALARIGAVMQNCVTSGQEEGNC